MTILINKSLVFNRKRVSSLTGQTNGRKKKLEKNDWYYEITYQQFSVIGDETTHRENKKRVV